MTQNEELQAIKASLDAIKEDVPTIQAGVTSLNQKIADLTAQIGAGGPVDQALLDSVAAEGADLQTAVDTLAATFTTPPPTPAP